MFLRLVLCTATLCLASHAWGQTPKFPFTAVVDVSSAYVRSGPGARFYPTAKLERGTEVQVVRQDLGGWYMIVPPEGSFSWIRGEYVDDLGNGRGQLNTNNVVVRIGTVFGDEQSVEQRRLSTGDQVQILETVTVQRDGQDVKMYKIAPPRGEYRWISGRDVIPADVATREALDNNPFNVPSQVRSDGDLPPKPYEPDAPAPRIADAGRPDDSGVTLDQGVAGMERAASPPSHGVRQTGPAPEDLEADRQRLAELDEYFRDMIRQDTATWSFADLEAGYRELRAAASSPAMKNQIELRFPALEKYKRIKQEYDEFVMLTTETQRRNAQLLRLQESDEPNTRRQNTASPGSLSGDSPRVPPADRTPRPKPNTSPTPAPQPRPAPAQPAPQQPREQATRNGFVGAGVIRFLPRAADPRLPRYVLTTPQGRILAYLYPDRGVDLSRHVNQAMGIGGQRSYRADLRADVILVQTLTPVRLKP